MSNREPIFRVPPGCLALCAGLLVVHILQVISGLNFSAYAVQPAEFAVAPLTLHNMITLFTYQFLHAGWLHLAVNAFTLLAFGSAMERITGNARFILLYLFFGVAAALAHVTIYADQTSYLIGASGAVSGVMGFVMWHLFRRHQIEMRTLMAMIILQPIMAYAGGDLLGGEIAWIAHVAGFVVGIGVALLPQRFMSI